MSRQGWIDAMRGLAIALMVLCDDAGTAWNCMLEHAPWHGLTLADIVFPLFLHTSGLSLPKSRHNRIISRTFRLIVVGILLQGRRGRFELNFATLRLPGILQRVALAGLPLQILLTFGHTSRRALLLSGLLATVYLYITHTEHGCQAGESPYNVSCNAAFEIDDTIFGWAHMYHYPSYRRTPACSSSSPCYSPRLLAPTFCSRHFDPEGLLGTVNAAVAVLLASIRGTLPMDDLIIAAIAGALGIALAALDIIPINKPLYTTSYLLVTFAISTYVACMVQEIWRRRHSSKVLQKVILEPMASMGRYPLWMFAIGGAGLSEFIFSNIRVMSGQTVLEVVQGICRTAAGYDEDWAEILYVCGKLVLMSGLAMYWDRGNLFTEGYGRVLGGFYKGRDTDSGGRVLGGSNVQNRGRNESRLLDSSLSRPGQRD